MKDILYDGASEAEAKKDAPEKQLPAPPVRSFHTDVTTLIEEGKTTKIDVLLAERARKEANEEVEKTSRGSEHHLGRIIFLLSLVLAFGIGVGIYALLQPTLTLPFSSEKTAPQKDIVILLSDSPREQVLADIAIAFKKTDLAAGETRSVQFLLTDPSSEYVTASTSELLTRIALTPPKKDFLRSLDPSALYGISFHGDKTGFFQLRTRSYPESFAGMLAWEPLMGEDLIPALHPWFKRSGISALRGRAFIDEKLGGIDARILKSPDGTSLVAYAFINKEILIISGDKDALQFLIEKFTPPINGQ